MADKNKSFCVKFKNHCKKITNPNESKIREVFKIAQSKAIFAQYYDKEFSNYIDIEWCEIMEVDSYELKILEEIYSCKPQSISKSPYLPRSDNIVINKSDSSTASKLMGSCKNEISLQIKRQNAINDKREVCTIEVEEEKDRSSIQPMPVNRNSPIKILSSQKVAANPQKKTELSYKFHTTSYILPEIPEVEEEIDGSSIQPMPVNRNSPIKILSSQKVAANPQKKADLSYKFHTTSYILPEIPEYSKLGKALLEKKPLSKSLKSLFLTKIYESFSSKKKYYVERGYVGIVHAILNTYPYLGGGLPYESAKHLWLKSLYIKFYNERRRSSNNEDVVNSKRKQIKQKANVAAGGNVSMFGIPYYHPSAILDDEEDQSSIDSYKKWMSLEFKSVNRNLEGITAGMKFTFMDRRNLLFTNNHGAPTNLLAKDILKEYPCLGLEDQAVGEIRRIFDDNDKNYNNYIKRFVIFSIKINEAVCNSRSKYKSYMNELFSNGNSCNFENDVMLKCLGNLSVLLLENPANIISKNLNETTAPMLNVMKNEKLNITVDGTVFIREVSPKNSAFLWLAAFLIFNKLPVTNKRTFDVLQHLFFNLPETPKLNQGTFQIVQMWIESDAKDVIKSNIKDELIIEPKIFVNPEDNNMDHLNIPDHVILPESHNKQHNIKTAKSSTDKEIAVDNNAYQNDIVSVIKIGACDTEDDNESMEFFIKTENCDMANFLTKYNAEFNHDRLNLNLHRMEGSPNPSNCSTQREDMHRRRSRRKKKNELQDSSEDNVCCIFCKTKLFKKCLLTHLLEVHNFAVDVATSLLPTSFKN